VQGIDENEEMIQRSIWYWFNRRATKRKKKTS